MSNLADKAIDFKGKKYVLVSDRVIYFNEKYPEGSITTELISQPDANTVVIKATIKPNDKQIFTGYSQATWGDGFVNKTSALENAETSAVGRALAFMGIGVLDSIASLDEINKAEIAPQSSFRPKMAQYNQQDTKTPPSAPQQATAQSSKPPLMNAGNLATPKQIFTIKQMYLERMGTPWQEKRLSKIEASEIIDELYKTPFKGKNTEQLVKDTFGEVPPPNDNDDIPF